MTSALSATCDLRTIASQQAVVYIRTSSPANAGYDEDSAKRQRQAIDACGAHLGYVIEAEFTDPGVSGVDKVVGRHRVVDVWCSGASKTPLKSPKGVRTSATYVWILFTTCFYLLPLIYYFLQCFEYLLLVFY